MGLVYLARCKVNGKCYVGKTRRCLKVRRSAHECGARAGEQGAFARALRKHGLHNFVWSILQDDCCEDVMNLREVYWIRRLRSKAPNGYNLTDGGEGTKSPVGLRRRNRNISKAKTGKKFGPLSDEHRRNVSNALKGREVSALTRKRIRRAKKGVKKGPLSAEWRRNIGNACRGKKLPPRTDLHRKRLGRALKGKPLSEAHKAAISRGGMGKTASESHRRNLSIALRGKPKSAIWRERLAEAARGKKASPETRRKMGIAAKKAWARRKKAEKVNLT